MWVWEITKNEEVTGMEEEEDMNQNKAEPDQRPR